jgi:NAD(P)H-dependent FMN reductase
MSALSILVPYDSVRRARQGIKAARFIVKSCQSRGHEVELVDPVEEDLSLLDRMYKEDPKGEAPAALERLAVRIKAADAFVIVSGEYNHSIPPALSSLLGLPGRALRAAVEDRLLLRRPDRRCPRRDAATSDAW